MAYTHFIPKIEWRKGTLSGTTSIGSPIVTGITNTDDILTGEYMNMFFEGTGIPAGAVVLSKTATTVTLDKNATVAATNTFSFGFRITFDHPPEGDVINTDPKFVGTTSTSKSGIQQTISDYIERETKLKFTHITQTIKDQFDYFLTSWCLAGNSFSYFFDKGEAASESVVQKVANYNTPAYDMIRRAGDGYNYMWKFVLNFRKVA